MKTAIIVDSTAYINKEIRNHPDIYELVLSATFDDGEQFPDISDDKIQKAFYEKLQKSDTLPSTSQPAPGEYIKLVEKIIDKGYEQLICIHVSQTFSGTYQTAKMITSEYEDQIKSHVIDSKGVSLIITSLVTQALDMLDKGLSFEEVCQKTEWSAKNSKIYVTVSDLDNLVKGGRLNSSMATIGNLLKVRPLLVVDEEGEIQLLDKIRTDKRVNNRLAEIAREDQEKYSNGVMLAFADAVDEERLKEAIKTVEIAVPNLPYEVGTLGPIIGTHTGVGTVGMGTTPIADY